MFMREALVMLAMVSGVDETVMLEFSAEWCGPCQTMQPTVRRLKDRGYPVRKIDIDRNPKLAARFNVNSVPCFILLANGREVDRVVGATSFDRLARMFPRAKTPASNDSSKLIRGQSPDRARVLADFAATTETVPRGLSDAARSDQGDRVSPVELAMSASVRLKIEHPGGDSYGSGTIIDVHQDEALVLTCGHIFRDSDGKGPITVHLFLSDSQEPVAGQLVGFDLKRDVGLVSIRPGVPVRPVRVAPSGYRVEPDSRVFSIGCDRGGPPRVQQSRVVSIDRFLGPPSLQVAGQPVDGRSGGGLFSSDGVLIGVCNAANPADDEGLYAAAASIRAELEHAGLSQVFSHSNALATGQASPSSPRSLATPQRDELASMPRQMQAAADAGSSDHAELETLANLPDGAEVICIVRSGSGSHGKNQVIVLDRPSRSFLDRLAKERHIQQARYATSLSVRGHDGALGPAAPVGRSTDRVSRGELVDRVRR